MFKKEISLDNDNESLNEEKHKKKLSSVKPPLKNKKILRNSFQSSKNFMNLSKNRIKHNVIYENKNIVINDITKNYNTNTNKTYHEKKQLSIIHKMSNDINSLNNTKYKFEVINTETKTKNISKKNTNTILKNKKDLNSDNKNEIKNTNKTSNSLKFRQSNQKQKSPVNRKILENMEKKRNNKKNIIQNKMKKFSFGDSYEFNFTFNNYNSNYTYNTSNIDENILKEEKKKTNKIIINSIVKENIINNFKSINPSSVRNNILGGLKTILDKNKNHDKKVTSTKILGRNEKLRKNIKKDKNYYSIIIQKIFRGYNSRKNYKLKRNFRTSVYKRKKICFDSKRSLNSNINNTENNLVRNSILEGKKKRLNLNYSKNLENNETLDNENKIQEIIIDKKKILNVLNPPSSKSNNIKEIHINNNYSFKNSLRNRKYKLLKYFNYWKNYSMKITILHKLIDYIKYEKNSKKNNIIEININAKKHKRSNNGFGFYKRRILYNNI